MSADSCQLLALPFEIRTMIWIWLFCGEWDMHVKSGSCEDCWLRYHETPAPSCSTPYLHFTFRIPICETCRQIKGEAERIWVKMCTLTFVDPSLCSLVYQNRLQNLLSGLKSLELYSHSLFPKNRSAPRKWSALVAVQTMPGLDLDILIIRCL